MCAIDALDEARRYVAASTPLRDSLGVAAGDELAVEPLGQGEHNANFVLRGSDDAILCVLRMSFSSQLGLENQVLYEARALDLLGSSVCAPRLLFADDSRSVAERGVLAIEFCPGRRLDFEREDDLQQAADCLARIHAVDPLAAPVAGRSGASMLAREGLGVPALLRPDSVLTALLTEDARLCERYNGWAKAEPRVTAWLERFERACASLLDKTRVDVERPSIVNTECIAAHFLISDDESPARMVDWEKAIVGDAAQDVAYFLSPTTTIWDDDFVFDAAQRKRFMRTYLDRAELSDAQSQRFVDHYQAFMPLICLRGISWCAAAKLDYDNPDWPLKNHKTEIKLEEYLSERFLCYVYDEFFR